MEYKDYYKILGVDKKADETTIKKAYRKLAKKYHPDTNPNNKASEEKFKEANEAYEVLSNKEKRSKYDQFGSNYQYTNGANFDPSQFGFNFNNARSGGSASGFSDFFDMFFSDGFNTGNLFGGRSGSRQSRRAPAKGADYKSEITINLKAGMDGESKTVTFNGKKVNIKIPQGIKDGQQIKLKGQGGKVQGGAPGDLYLKINLKPERGYSLNGSDIEKKINIFPWEAYFGIKKNVNILNSDIKLKIPKGIKGGGRIKLPGKGYYDQKGKRGNLYIVINIINPDKMDSESEKLYEKLMAKTK